MAGWDRGGGGGLNEEVLAVLLDVQLTAEVLVTSLRLGTVTSLGLVPWGRHLHGKEGLQGREEARRHRASWERPQGAVLGRLNGKARESGRW